MNDPLRVLVFFPVGTDASQVQEDLAAVQHATEKPVLLIDSLSWYEVRFSACGNWDSWALEAAKGKSYRDRKPYFHAFVITGDGKVGQGTAKVIELAQSAGKSVYYLKENDLLPVREIAQVGSEWTITTGGQRD